MKNTDNKKAYIREGLLLTVLTLLYALSSNFFFFSIKYPWLWFPAVFAVILINIVPQAKYAKKKGNRIKFLSHGYRCLVIFLYSTIFSLVWHVLLFFGSFGCSTTDALWSVLVCVISLSIIFWNGMISVYLTSVQLGIKTRVLGMVFALIPPANIVLLIRITSITGREIKIETEKISLDDSRNSDQVCKTKYPLLLVHGVFFRDFKYLNYWGRIPDELEKNGAEIFYGNHQSAQSVEESGNEIADRIEEICKKNGYEKVNIIAHSKGGLDCRWAIAKCGSSPYVASLTTINTPHRGCEFADYLLDKIPEKIQKKIAGTYESAARHLGDKDPDFLTACRSLRKADCISRNEEMPVPEDILCTSYGSQLKRASGGKFPLNMTNSLVKYFDGPNDGLVSVGSCSFGSDFTMLKPTGRRGISHGDVIDLNRENIKGFDVRELYVGIVSGLKNKGL